MSYLNGLVVFPTLHFKSEFHNKEIMIWATVSSQSCFCWLYRASPSLAAKNIINLISELTIWWCPYVVISCVVGTECLLWSVCSLHKALLDFALIHVVFQIQICLLFQTSLDFLLLHSSSLWWNELFFFFFGVSSRRSYRSSYNHSSSSSSALLISA